MLQRLRRRLSRNIPGAATLTLRDVELPEAVMRIVRTTTAMLLATLLGTSAFAQGGGAGGGSAGGGAAGGGAAGPSGATGGATAPGTNAPGPTSTPGNTSPAVPGPNGPPPSALQQAPSGSQAATPRGTLYPNQPNSGASSDTTGSTGLMNSTGSSTTGTPQIMAPERR
jgi:hypothetical protein